MCVFRGRAVVYSVHPGGSCQSIRLAISYFTMRFLAYRRSTFRHVGNPAAGNMLASLWWKAHNTVHAVRGIRRLSSTEHPTFPLPKKEVQKCRVKYSTAKRLLCGQEDTKDVQDARPTCLTLTRAPGQRLPVDQPCRKKRVAVRRERRSPSPYQARPRGRVEARPTKKFN